MIESPALAAISGVRHGFFTRGGGVSAGVYATLNCGYGSNDDREKVARNRAICAERLGAEPGNLITAYQIHGVTVADVETPWRPAEAPRADAMVTRRPGVALGILTADCTPVLLADGEAGVIGAAHAGWKGAKAGVLQAVVAAMIRLGADPDRIVAAVGPTIGRESYEVGHEFRDAFLAEDPAAARFFNGDGQPKPHFDLGSFVAAQLESLGLTGIQRIAGDTYAEPDRFFSYRRTCHAGETDYGRQLSAIMLG